MALLRENESVERLISVLFNEETRTLGPYFAEMLGAPGSDLRERKLQRVVHALNSKRIADARKLAVEFAAMQRQQGRGPVH